MALAGAAVQRALYDALRADAPLTDMLGGMKVFDYVPEQTEAPFVVLGDDTDAEVIAVQFTDLQDAAHEQAVTLHAWTESKRGRLGVKDILSRFHDVLIEVPFLVTGFQVIEMAFLGAQVLREEDGLTYHGVFRCRCVTAPTGGGFYG